MIKRALHIFCRRGSILTLLLLLLACCVYAQRRTKENARYEIDAKRYGVDLKSEEALPRGKEFIRLDSTYYVGWMMEGLYKHERSADALGFKNAVIPLRKAYDLLTTEFDENFHRVFLNYSSLQKNFTRFYDLLLITGALIGAYDNINMPDSSMRILNDIGRYKFKVDNLEELAFGQYFHKAWLYHRNRFLTGKQFAFLKNSIEANEKAAFDLCYSGLRYADEHKELSDEWFGENVNIIERLRIYHNLAILHSYNKNYDSSAYYYSQLNDYGVMSQNNYAGLQLELGNFADAEHYFSLAKEEKDEGYSLREPFYFLPQLLVFSGKTKEAIEMDNRIIYENGSTPGFGWYNIALARSYLYDGQLDSCEIALKKALNFKELHIGTTLTQSQYDFTINLLKLQLTDKKVEQIKFANRGWWYSFKTLWKILSLKIEKYVTEYNTAFQLTKNPEKDRMVYDLFCSESTTTYDEAWYLLKDFSSTYFERKYREYQHTDKRENIHRYFKLFEAKFQLQGGRVKTARQSFNAIIQNVTLDTTYEKLYMGRLYEGAIKSNKIFTEEYNHYCNSLYTTYPQLIPFSDIRIPMKLVIAGEENENIRAVIKELRKANIAWTDKDNIPKAEIRFEQRGNKYHARINTYNAAGKQVVVNENVFFSKTAGTGTEIALRLFGKGGAQIID